MVWALGVNAGVNLSTIESSMRQAISDVWAAQDVASQVHCSQALVIPYATGTTTDSTWNGVRDIYYKVAASLGCAVWDWAELTGSVSHPTGGPNEDVYGMTSDNVHPGTTGQVMIGSWLSNKVLQALSPSLPAEVVAADGALRFKRIYESANYH